MNNNDATRQDDADREKLRKLIEKLNADQIHRLYIVARTIYAVAQEDKQ